MPTTMHKPDFSAQRSAGQKYFERCMALSASGIKPFILSKRDHPGQWLAWKSFYRTRGLWALVDLMDDGRQEKAVPTMEPADFEPQPVVVAPDRRVKDD